MLTLPPNSSPKAVHPAILAVAVPPFLRCGRGCPACAAAQLPRAAGPRCQQTPRARSTGRCQDPHGTLSLFPVALALQRRGCQHLPPSTRQQGAEKPGRAERFVGYSSTVPSTAEPWVLPRRHKTHPPIPSSPIPPPSNQPQQGRTTWGKNPRGKPPSEHTQQCRRERAAAAVHAPATCSARSPRHPRRERAEEKIRYTWMFSAFKQGLRNPGWPPRQTIAHLLSDERAAFLPDLERPFGAVSKRFRPACLRT